MHRSLLSVFVLLAASVVACSGSPGSPTTAPATLAPQAATAAPASMAATGPTVSADSSGNFVGPDGLTLYHFDKDTAGVSNCASGSCATNWPALTITSTGAISVGPGLDAGDFATITGQNGNLQVTFNSIPLYFFAGDSKPGDKNGDGIGGLWHVATASATLASAAPSIAASVSPSAGASAAPSTAASSPAVTPKVCYDAYHYVEDCPSTSPAASQAAGSPSGATVSIATSGNHVNSAGFSLYMYDKDTTAGQSACTGACAGNWPALTVSSASAIVPGNGLDAEDFATITRDDGSLQLTYYGKPLYMFSGDTAAGQVNGDGVLNVWHLAKPE